MLSSQRFASPTPATKMKMDRVFGQLLECMLCGDCEIDNRERIYADRDKDGYRGMCCSRDCQLELLCDIQHFYSCHPGYVMKTHKK